MFTGLKAMLSINLARRQIISQSTLSQKYESKYFIAKEWTVSNTVKELLSFFRARAYGLCWQLSEDMYQEVMKEFEAFCQLHYGSLDKILSSRAKFEIEAYRAKQ